MPLLKRRASRRRSDDRLSRQLRQGTGKRFGKRFEDINGEVLATVFHAGEMLVSDAGLGGQLVLGELFLFAKFANKTPDDDFGIHFTHS